MKTIFFLGLVLLSNAFAECGKDVILSGYELNSLQKNKLIYLHKKNGIYVNSKNVDIENHLFYKAQIDYSSHEKSDIGEYNKKYIEYYSYDRLNKFLNSNRSLFEANNYTVKEIGQSLQGRSLYAIMPSSIDIHKKTIIMFGRHHGDEGTANWLIEGFLKSFFSQSIEFHDEFQLVLYPMINPDGAELMSRFNSKGRDLNRSWNENVSKSFDEIKIINKDLKPKVKSLKNIPIVLDMHGSFTEDFIFRVKKRKFGRNYYNLQQTFIDQLGSYDKWQNGLYKPTNGHPSMARIVLGKSYSLNTLTHETIRNIKKSKKRTLKDLFNQGVNILMTIKDLY